MGCFKNLFTSTYQGTIRASYEQRILVDNNYIVVFSSGLHEQRRIMVIICILQAHEFLRPLDCEVPLQYNISTSS